MNYGRAEALRALPARRIAAALADAATRWQDADFPPRVRATRALMERLAYTEPVVDYALDRLFGSISYAAIEQTIVSELGSLEALDGFVARTGRPACFARGVELVSIVASDTTIGVALPPLLFALCAKAAVSVRDRADALLASFAQTLSEEEPAFAHALTVHAFSERARADQETARADVVIAFGSDATMQALRAACKPQARFIPFGHRTSIAYVPREALADVQAARRHARGIALDALLYDGDGCLSLHAAFVERGGEVGPQAFAELVAAACDILAVEFPSAAGGLAESTAAYRDRAHFRAAQGEGAVYATRDKSHLIVFAPLRDEPPPLFARALGIYPVDGPGDVLTYLRAQRLPLEGVASPPTKRNDLLDAFAASGAARITGLGELQNPPLTGNHGAVGRITPFVSFITRDA
ncbi:MAG TPA: acyl-CoA reductase [Candidatus Baltobacteraceae bacterium]